MPLTIAAIDASLSCTAITSGTSLKDYQSKSFSAGKNRGPSVSQRFGRFEAAVGLINNHLHEVKPDVIVIEDYAFSKNTAAAASLKEYGSLIRWHLLEHTNWIFEVSASTLKKFATGKGNCEKNLVMMNILKNFGVECATDDEADSFALYAMGLAAAGQWDPTNEKQREAVAVAFNGQSLDHLHHQPAF